MNLILSQFQGISPRFDPDLKAEKGLAFARIAQNIDLSSGKIKSLLDNLLQETDTNLYNSLIRYNNVWEKGNDRYYCTWKIGTLDLLFYLDGGILKKKVGSSVADLGQIRLGLSTLAGLNIVKDLTDGTTYRWIASLNGTNEYYCELIGGGNPSLIDPDELQINSIAVSRETIGTLASGTFAYGDNEDVTIDLVDAVPTYRWILSTAVGAVNEYYCELFGGGNPGLVDPDEVHLNGIIATEGTLGSLVAGTWDYGNNDTLGFNTVYVRLSDGTDPDTKAPGYVEHVMTLGFSTVYVRLADGTDPDTKTPGYVKHIDQTGVLSGTYQYIITTTRSVGGHIDESGPSTPSAEITVDLAQIRITRPTITDTDVTHWNIYRVRTDIDAGEYQFVAQVAAATATYDDNIPDANLDTSPTTWYTSDQGNEIIFDKPLTGMDGLITLEPYSSMLFFWKDSTLYWTEPGYPDAAPSFYNMNFPSDIKRSISFAGTLAVLTAIGPFRVDGTHPELLQQSQVLGKEPCIGLAACKTRLGVAYLCDSGIALFNLVDTSVISDTGFTEKWFNNNVSSSGAVMAENDNVLYLFHSGGTLVVDGRSKELIWTTLPLIAYAAYKDEIDGYLYVIDSSGVKKIQGDITYLTWLWRSGNLLLGTPEEKEFPVVEVLGSGTDIVLNLYLDGILKATKTLDFTNERGRRLGMPEGERGRALQVSMTGTGEAWEIIIGGSDE